MDVMITDSTHKTTHINSKWVDVLIPSYGRPTALALTLTSLCAQTFRDFNVIISDQSDREVEDPFDRCELQAIVRILRIHGHNVHLLKHLPRRGLAEQRQFLFEQARAPYLLYLDNDVIIESDLIGRLVNALQEEGCGFVGSAVIGLSYLDDIRPHQQKIEFWNERVQPEIIQPYSTEWRRHYLHNAANLYHVQKKLGLNSKNQRKYKIAWVGGCVLFDAAKLSSVGAFSFWHNLPKNHCGEDVLAQWQVMARFGGCALIPSGAYHLELPTTVIDRQVDAPIFLSTETQDSLNQSSSYIPLELSK